MKGFPVIGLAAAMITAMMTLPPESAALYQAGDDLWGVELNGSLDIGLGEAFYPDETFVYDEHQATVWNGDLRLIADGHYGRKLRGEVNLLQNVRSTPAAFPAAGGYRQQDVERSGTFFLEQHDSDNTQAFLVIDSGRLTYDNSRNEFTIGRQPISTTVTFYFTANDFFAPFAPQNFYRVYKAGVDAARLEHRLSDLSLLSVIGVLGYAKDESSDSGWSRAPNWERTSILEHLA